MLNINHEILGIDKGWSISFDPAPIPLRSMDYQFVHDNYDYCVDEGDNGLSGQGKSIQDCIDQIKEIEAEMEV